MQHAEQVRDVTPPTTRCRVYMYCGTNRKLGPHTLVQKHIQYELFDHFRTRKFKPGKSEVMGKITKNDT